jgi:hypothetical protein
MTAPVKEWKHLRFIFARPSSHEQRRLIGRLNIKSLIDFKGDSARRPVIEEALSSPGCLLMDTQTSAVGIVSIRMAYINENSRTMRRKSS